MTPTELKRIKAARTMIKVLRDMADERNIPAIAKVADEALNLLKFPKTSRHQSDTEK